MKEESSDDPKSSSDEKNRDEKDTKGMGVRSKMDGQAKLNGETSTFSRSERPVKFAWTVDFDP